MCVIGFTFLTNSPHLRAVELAGSPVTIGFPDDSLYEYQAYRRMHAWCDRSGHEAWMDVWTELKAGQFRYQVVSERGSDVIRTRVLRVVLGREQELINEGQSDRAELTHANYTFMATGRNPDGSQYIQIKPRRKDSLLVDGRMVLTADGQDLLRVEGRLAKNPSFWTNIVNVVRHYARLGGVPVPVSLESTAEIKFAGTSQLEVSYEYESINGRPVNLSAQRH
jgi:hypothetical protein